MSLLDRCSLLGILEVLQKVDQERDVTWSGVVAVAGENVESIHDDDKSVNHTKHELTDNTTIRILRAFGTLVVGSAVELGQVGSVDGVG